MGKYSQRKKPEARKVESRWSDEAIRKQLERVLGHEEFHATDKMRDFLRYVVEESLAGRSKRIKGFSIATEVYGRDSDFDASHDPVVRIQAGRLRRAIERYYLVGGRQDPIRIDIPTGGYMPVFSVGPGMEDRSDQGRDLPKQASLAESCPVLLIVPFEDLTGNPEHAYLGIGLATELSVQLGHCADLRVIQHREGASSAGKLDVQPDFTVKGSVFCDGSTIKVVAQLFDSKTGVQLWVDSLKSPLESNHLLDFQERAANSICSHIAGEHGVIIRLMMTENRNRAATDLTTYQAVLKGYAYWEKVDAVSYRMAFEALQHEVAKGCDSGLVYTILSLLYFDNISQEFFDLDQTPMDEALRLAREGVQLEPNNQLGRLALARGHFLHNQMHQALNDVEKALAIQPESLLFLDGIGYVLILLGEWDRGEQMVRKAIRLNPYYRLYARYGLWLNAFRQQEYTRALEESEWISEIADFWGPLARAATLGQMGLSEKGQEEVQRLLFLKPNFAERGRLLIAHAVKFPEIADRLIEGLSLAGLDID